MNFWTKLARPCRIMAPMDGVSDYYFREVLSLIGAPDVYFTEFVNAAMLLKKAPRTMQKLLFSENQRPIVAQIWGNNPTDYRAAAKIISDLGFDGLDINMGCPHKKLVQKGRCSALIKNIELARDLFEAARDATQLPVSIKTRIGFDSISISWLKELLTWEPAALTVHCRLARPPRNSQNKEDLYLWQEAKKQVSMSLKDGAATWPLLKDLVKFRNEAGLKSKIIANGGLFHTYCIENISKWFAVDGVMIARAIFDNPYIFRDPDSSSSNFTSAAKEEKLNWLQTHLDLLQKPLIKNNKLYPIPPAASFKKFIKIYVAKFSGAEELLRQFMDCENYAEILELNKINSVKLNHHR